MKKQTSVLNTNSAKTTETSAEVGQYETATYYPMAAHLHPQTAGTDTSGFHSKLPSTTMSIRSQPERKIQYSYHQERLHFVLFPRRYLIHIDNTRISTSLDFTMFLNCLEYVPSVIPVTGVSGETEGQEQRLYSLWAVEC